MAKQLGDLSYGYSASILARCQETAGWLWKQADISREIDDVLCEYEIISLARPLCGYNDFVQYKNVLDALKYAITENNHLPKQLIEAFYPTLASFLSAMQSTGASQDVKLGLQQNFVFIQRLFFDQAKQDTLAILKSRLDDVVLEDSDLRDILSEMVGGFGLDENTFLTNIRVKIEEFAKKSVVLKIKSEWVRISDAETPAEWAISNGMPARHVFGSHPDAADLLRAVEHPETFASAKLTDILEALKEVRVANIADCQKALMDDVIPARYKNFDISLTPLLDFISSRYGSQPNNWSLRPDITEFIKSQYKGTIAPQIKAKLRGKSAEDLKARILLLADDNPELGLLFWED